jgi:hypothetical protein
MGLCFRAWFWTKLPLCRFLFPGPSNENHQVCSAQPHCWGRLLFHGPKTYQDFPLFKTLPTYHFERVFPRLFVGSPFSPTLSQSEGAMLVVLLSIIVDGLFYVVTSLKSTLHPIHLICLVYLTPRWPSSSTLCVALTLIDLVTPKCYLVS